MGTTRIKQSSLELRLRLDIILVEFDSHAIFELASRYIHYKTAAGEQRIPSGSFEVGRNPWCLVFFFQLPTDVEKSVLIEEDMISLKEIC